MKNVKSAEVIVDGFTTRKAARWFARLVMAGLTKCATTVTTGTHTTLRSNYMYDFVYLTPEEATAKNVIDGINLIEYQRRASSSGTCENCDNPVWKLPDLGMCFSCVTGETDASEDYELT